MRITGLTLALVLLFLTACLAEADEPLSRRSRSLAAPVPIMAAGEAINVGGYAAPFAGDFDGDGKNDLLVGQFDEGRLRIYRNVGTNKEPRFDGYEWFKVGGAVTGIPGGCRVGFTPQLVDFDKDGLSDIVTGSFQAELYLFRRQKDGFFAEAEVLQNKRGEIQMGRGFPGNNRCTYNSTVFAHDWDRDGDQDLLLGRTRYSLVLNEGTSKQPVFGDAVALECDGKSIPSGIVAPVVADWDGDGIDDLVVGRENDIVWYRNVGMKGQPLLHTQQVLISMRGVNSGGDGPPPDEPTRPQAICVADFNDDGHLDLILGDMYMQRLPNAGIVKLNEDELKKKYALGNAYQKLRKQPDGETREQRAERFRNVIHKWQEYGPLKYAGASVKRHGRVWLYTRIAD